MEFSWDESKRESVLQERGIDFLRVAFSLFDGRPLLTVPTPRDEEERFLSIGRLDLARRDDTDYHSKESEG